MNQPAPQPAPQPSEFLPGTVALVGAGPGDPELLTLKAVKAIAAATVLLVDDLVSRRRAGARPPGARIIHVGKRGGCKSTPQAFIEKLMVMAAREGEVVVRLKGGDPFIFGRGGEEVEHLRAQGIRCRWSTASPPAWPASHRWARRSRTASMPTAWCSSPAMPNPGDAGTDWRAIAATARDARLTLVIYMGVRGSAHIQEELLTGLPPSPPWP
jgi:uroporphyrin-III C-methyltransferase